MSQVNIAVVEDTFSNEHAGEDESCGPLMEVEPDKWTVEIREYRGIWIAGL